MQARHTNHLVCSAVVGSSDVEAQVKRESSIVATVRFGSSMMKMTCIQELPARAKSKSFFLRPLLISYAVKLWAKLWQLSHQASALDGPQ